MSDAMNNDELMLYFLMEEEDDDDLLLLHYKRKRKPTRSLFKNRQFEGSYSILIKKHLMANEDIFRSYCRLNKKQFNFIFSFIQDDINAKVTRNAISGEEKLFLTLRFLATGESYRSLSFQYRISKSYISRIVKSVLKCLKDKLLPVLMTVPTENDFKCVEQDFWQKWNIPNCIGGIDDKHVRIKAPKNSGSLFFNYKEYFSIVLLAIVDANYKFLAVDVGSYGKESDNGIFQKLVIGKKIANNRFNIPPPKNLPGSQVILPHFLIGDEAFALSNYMMKPYSRRLARLEREKQIYNYRLCRGRRVTENAFGLLSQVFRVFYTPIAVAPDIVDDLILTACCLHNLLRDGYLEENNYPFFNYDNEEKPSQDNMLRFARHGGFNNNEGFQIRDKLKDFFCSEYGAVAWQEDAINSGP
ncbi:uncharacterized protein LOC126892490 [Diabrotica virgifera virgifera]|uniref:DDE Tnp4 domain-containing protein n=1 Tax=Diabrotica virgifera virgifera TaxID=50390 RepID=A0ABM5L6C6_DIAVI|nr:uncharacterized protein LOC126892490 [Diabrotica virgifera virgifera]